MLTHGVCYAADRPRCRTTTRCLVLSWCGRVWPIPMRIDICVHCAQHVTIARLRSISLEAGPMRRVYGELLARAGNLTIR